MGIHKRCKAMKSLFSTVLLVRNYALWRRRGVPLLQRSPYDKGVGAGKTGKGPEHWNGCAIS